MLHTLSVSSYVLVSLATKFQWASKGNKPLRDLLPKKLYILYIYIFWLSNHTSKVLLKILQHFFKINFFLFISFYILIIMFSKIKFVSSPGYNTLLFHPLNFLSQRALHSSSRSNWIHASSQTHRPMKGPPMEWERMSIAWRYWQAGYSFTRLWCLVGNGE